MLISPMLQMRGYVRAFPIASGSGAEDATGDSHTFTLEKGVSYLITGRCDAACSNVDVSLFDGAGQMLNSDTDDDDFPTVSFTPQATGSYRVSARIVTCHEEPCAYGVAVFRRDETTGSKQTSARP